MKKFTPNLHINRNIIIENCYKGEVTQPKVSVIIPAYNTEKYIFKCLLSLIQQSLKEIEIIIINDGSTDNTSSIISLFAQSDSRIKVINQTNKKQGAARNNGMRIASGEYIGFIDSDDWIDLNYYEKLYNAAKKHNADIALATNVRIGNGLTKKRLNILKEEIVTTLQEKFDINKQSSNPCATNKIYKMSMIKNNNIFWSEGVYCEDKLFTAQAVYYANAVVTVPEINYYYFRNPYSTVNYRCIKHKKALNSDKDKAALEVLNFLKKQNAQIRDKDFWAVTKKLCFLIFPYIS